MRAARQDGLPGAAAGASLALHLGAGLWLALGGAVPGGPAPREVPVGVAFLPASMAGVVEATDDAPASDAAPEPVTAAPMAAAPSHPTVEPDLPVALALPEPVAEAPPTTEALAPEHPAIAVAPEPIAEPLVKPTPPTPAERPPVPPKPKPVAALRTTPRRPVQPAAARGAPREAAPLASQGAAAIPVAAAALAPGPPPLITQARYRHAPTPPAYPPRAIAFRMAGTALIRALVGPDGQTREIRLNRSSGFAELDQAAMAAVRGWAFAAANEGGRPIEAWVEVPVRFRLDD
jgi:protein TonB